LQQNSNVIRVYGCDDAWNYAVAIDIYQDWAHVQDIRHRKGVDPEKSQTNVLFGSDV